MPEKILIIEDEARMRRVLQLVLETQKYIVETAADGEDGIIKWGTFKPDLVFTDLKMPRADGMEVLKYGNRQFPGTPVIILTAFGTIPAAVEAMKQGASDYITKPVDNEVIIKKAKIALGRKQVDTDPADPGQPLLTGVSSVIRAIRRELKLVAGTNTSVLITGDSGTGKELAARTIHLQSPRRNNPIVRLNCAAIPGELMESELFGHKKGAFTGAVNDRTGAFAEADGGTLFLDELGELPYTLQAKLLHAVEEKTITPVGSAKSLKVDVKIISATNQNIEKMIEQKTFRSDLYFRLNTYSIHMPPLKDRAEDIPELADLFLKFFSKSFNKATPLLTNSAMERLSRHTWPGNVRELKNTIERLLLITENREITKDIVDQAINKNTIHSSSTHEAHGKKDLFVREQEIIKDTLAACNWNISKAARHLNITRNTLRYRIKKFNIK